MNIVFKLWLDFPHNAGEETFVVIFFFSLYKYWGLNEVDIILYYKHIYYPEQKN